MADTGLGFVYKAVDAAGGFAGEPKADDRFDWANEVALGGPDTAPDDGGFVFDGNSQPAVGQQFPTETIKMTYHAIEWSYDGDGSIDLLGTSHALAPSDYY